jgi:hypothetical protein
MARIRTVKPEFWLNEELASTSEHARLLAIALLNVADDKGYFKANAKLLRAACFPFDDDSKKCLGSIQELSKIGYVEIRISECGREIGRIVKFSEHQRIDKPKPSVLAKEFSDCPIRKNDNPGSIQDESMTNPGSIQDESQEEGKGREAERNGKERKGKDTIGQKRVLTEIEKRFEEWYSLYPRKIAKSAALQAYKKAIHLLGGESSEAADTLIVESKPRLLDLAKKEKQFIPHPASWLNSGRWADEIETPVKPISRNFNPGPDYDPRTQTPHQYLASKGIIVQ